MSIFETRHQTRYFDHEKIPSKELIEKVLYKTHELVPSKQNLMPYVVKILGPEHTEIKMYMYELACEVEYPNLNLRNKYRLDEIKQYEHNNVSHNKRFQHGNSQLFAPYILLLVPRKPIKNPKLSKTYEERGLAGFDGKKPPAGRKTPNVEIGMFSVILTTVSIEEGLSVSYTSCLNARKLMKKYDWLKKELTTPTLALSLGYEREDDKRKTNRQNHHYLKGIKKPEKQQTFEWI